MCDDERRRHHQEHPDKWEQEFRHRHMHPPLELEWAEATLAPGLSDIGNNPVRKPYDTAGYHHDEPRRRSGDGAGAHRAGRLHGPLNTRVASDLGDEPTDTRMVATVLDRATVVGDRRAGALQRVPLPREQRVAK